MTDQDRAIPQTMLYGVGAIMMCRKSFDKNEGDGGWGEKGPIGDSQDRIGVSRGDPQCFVVTHNKPTASYPSVFTFVTNGVASAIA